MLQVFLSCFSKVNADNTSANAGTISDNLIKFENWQGLTYGQDPGDCCSSISGSGALGDINSETIMFSYGTDILYQTIAIQQALQASGIEVDGYQYGWTFRMISNSGRGGDTLEFEVTVKDSNGNEVERQTYNRSSPLQDSWITESGAHYFASPYLDPQNIQLKITGRDGGFWAGYYGPEVKDVDLRLIYSVNPCASNPLHDPSCSGYADALAQQEYDNNCSANALYDSGCPGYANAYYTQQCSINPLHDSGCPGYEQAYYDQQCTADSLYDSGCTGYAEAYHDQQCGLDTLHANTCPGYAEAYFDQQCGLDPLYDASCPGYQQAFYDQQCGLDPLYDQGCQGYQQAYFDQQCGINTLYDSACPGYEQAFYDQQCSIDPLYDQNCPGFATAYYDQQCSIDPLYDSGCSGYQDAFFAQQCSIDPLYNSQCPGYQQAYYDQQCSEDPLYDSGCPGYETAFFDQQCGLDSLYDPSCPGYEQAYFEKYVKPEQERLAKLEEEKKVVVNVETYEEPSVTGDAVIDDILGDLNETPTKTFVMETSTVETMPIVQESQEEVETVEETDSAGELEELIDEVEQSEEVADTSTEDELRGDVADGEDTTDQGRVALEDSTDKEEPEESKVDEKKSKEDKKRKIVAKKAAETANQIASAVTLEQQRDLQNRLIALIGYNPSFADYQTMINGGYLPDAQGYEETKVPESRRGLRNGLAQQILHEKMVEMQYAR